MTSNFHTRCGGVKQQLQHKDVNLPSADFKASIDTKFDINSNCLNTIEKNSQRHVSDIPYFL